MWPKAWQIACSVDHVAEPGDFYEYRAGWLSILVVRGDDGVLRAFQNACRHRGNMICQGTGNGLDELRCPYHRWAWNTDGRLREVPVAPMVRRDGQRRVRPDPGAGRHAGARSVWVNLDLDAMPLDRVAGGRARGHGVGRLRRLPLQQPDHPADAGELEGRLRGVLRDVPHPGRAPARCSATSTTSTPPRSCGTATAVSYQDYGVPSPRLGRNVPDHVVWDTWVRVDGQPPRASAAGEPCPEVPEGQTDPGRDRPAAWSPTRPPTASTSPMFDTKRHHRCESQYNFFPNAHDAGLVRHDQQSCRPGPG